jgi:hypothetical protein
MNRLNNMIGSGRSNRRFMVYVSLSVIGFLVFLYLIIGKLTAGCQLSYFFFVTDAATIKNWTVCLWQDF